MPTDKQLLKAYKKLRSVHAVGRMYGMYGQTVHDRLRKIGCQFFMPRWGADSDAILIKEYVQHRDAGKLRLLASRLTRTVPFICRKAKALGLTDYRHKKLYACVWKGMAESDAAKIFFEFKRSTLGVGQFCKKKKYDDLGFSKTMKRWFPDEWEHVVESKQPRQSLYRLGRTVEYNVRDHLISCGYPIALRSPRSGGPADIVALRTGKQLLVQCKRSLQISVREWNSLFDLAVSVGAVPVLAGRPTGRGLAYFRLTARKDGSKRRQPMVPFNPESFSDDEPSDMPLFDNE